MARTGVVVLNFGPPDDTLTCLDSLERSDDLDQQVLVVDNGPAGTPDHERLRDGVGDRAEVLATGENLGYAGGNNVGLRHLLAGPVDRLWVLNPDTVADPGTLSGLHAHLDAHPDCAVVGPRLVVPGEPDRVWLDGAEVDPATGAITLHHGNAVEAECPPGPATEVGYVAGAAMLLRRSALEDVGLLPEEYFLYFEETAWCLAAARRGWRVMVDPGVRMAHLKRSVAGALPTPYFVYYLTRNRRHFDTTVLGLDGEESVRRHRATMVARWRAHIGAHAPRSLATFDDLVAQAEADGARERMGRSEAVAGVEWVREA